jgi:hypothetical protein
MRPVFVFIAIALFGCFKNTERKSETDDSGDSIVDSTNAATEKPVVRTYSNMRFKDVTVQKLGDGKYSIRGKGQIFEANFGWVVEDGHEELLKGHQMTDAGAPEWGKFEFPIEVKKQRPNSTLTLILFESSAKDGSRQHELPIALE